MIDSKVKKTKTPLQDVLNVTDSVASAAEVKAAKLTIGKTLMEKKSGSQPVNTLHTGRRKNAVARVMVKPGTGNVTVNKLSSEKYFPRESHRQNLLKPFAITNTLGQYDVVCTVKGGGHTGQSGAILLGIARALDKIDTEFRPLLKQDRLLTRDSRVVERKKYGKRKARKSTQFSKR